MENNEIIVNEEEEIEETEPEIVQADSDFPCGIGYAVAGAVIGVAGIIGTRLIGKALKPVVAKVKEKIQSRKDRRQKDEIIDVDCEPVSDEEDETED